MAKLFYSNLEYNEEYGDVFALTVYFDGYPSDDEVKAACVVEASKHTLSVNPEDEYFVWFHNPDHPVAKRAGLVRVQCHPTA